MKTSSKILTGLLITILIVIVSFLLDIRVFGKRRGEQFSITKSEQIPSGSYAHIYVDQFKSLKIAHADSSYFEYVVFNDSVTINFNYSIVNDTLKINGESLPPFASCTLFTHTGIESINVINSHLNFSGLNQDSIHLALSDAEIHSYGNSSKSHFKNAVISQLNSKIYFNNIKVDTVELVLKNSNANFGTDIHWLSASVDSTSRLDLRYVATLELERDINSTVYMR